MALSANHYPACLGLHWPRLIRWLGSRWFGTLLLLAAAPLGQAEPLLSKEAQVKAAFLYNFTKFIEWPTNCFDSNDSPLVIGILGPESFAKEVENAVSGRSQNGRIFTVKRIEKDESARTVHLLFICGTEGKRISAVFETIKGKAILTVGETDAFVKMGGIINFFAEGDKIRFEINPDAATRSDLKLSAQLLKLAKIIRKP